MIREINGVRYICLSPKNETLFREKSMTSLEDFILWPDGTVCTREELPQMTHMSDDYAVISHGTPDWYKISDQLG